MSGDSTLSPRQELLQIQKKIFARNDGLIRSQALVKERTFNLYERRYKRRVRDFEKVSGQEELIESILESDILYVGDYHTNRQSQRSLLRLLKQLASLAETKKKDLRFGLGLELVLKKHQAHLQDYLDEKISE